MRKREILKILLLDLSREDVFTYNLPRDMEIVYHALALNINVFYKQRSNSMCVIRS